MKQVQFYSLPRPTQERFVSATQGCLAPVPLASTLEGSPRHTWLFSAALLGVVSVVGLLAWGFGDLSSPWSQPGRVGELAVGIVAAASLTCLLRGLILRDRLSALPYERATYLFPAGVVVATTETLDVFPVSECQLLRRDVGGLTVGFAGREPFYFECTSDFALNSAEQALRRAQAQFREDRAPRSRRAMAEIDPLCTSHFPAPLSSPDPLQPRPRSIGRLLTIGAAAAGFALGYEVGEVRNLVSEQRVLAVAKATDSVEAYQTYVRHGGDNSQVTRVLLPRARLRSVTQQGSIEALQVFSNTHGASDIRSDIDRALTKALLNALAQARAEGTLASLEAFKQRYPDHEAVAQQLGEARHEVFVEAADAFEEKVRSPTHQRDVGRFFRSLLSYSEQHGPGVEVRFRRQLGTSVADADRKVRSFRQGQYYQGAGALPSRQFTRQQLEPIEQATLRDLTKALQSHFPKELLAFHIGPALAPLDEDASDRALPKFDKPTLVVDYRLELSGELFPTQERNLFVGAGYYFDARWAMPVAGPPLRVRLTTWRNPERLTIRAPGAEPADIYGDMNRRAFDSFVQRYLKALVATPAARFGDMPLAIRRRR